VARGDLNGTSFVVLGILASGDFSAYDISNIIGRGVGEVWPLAERQRYNAPKKLVEFGYATARTEATGKRTRTVYSITPAGRDALREWLARPPAPSELEFEGGVRLVMADEGTIEDLRLNLATIAEQSRRTKDLFVRHAVTMSGPAASFPARGHLLALANRQMVVHFKAMADWADWALAETETWDDTVSPATTHRERTMEILAESIREGTD
jgi:PadR family transcriptional regulator, regulatory protein AphA